MSHHQNHSSDQPTLPLENVEDDYEVITSEEVDTVLDALEKMISTIGSENIRSYLEEAADNIFSLVYGDEDLHEHAQDEAA